ncbi:hypothetical protein GCM10010273_32650 [Streptomyces lavendulocolor]
MTVRTAGAAGAGAGAVMADATVGDAASAATTHTPVAYVFIRVMVTGLLGCRVRSDMTERRLSTRLNSLCAAPG